MAYTPVNWQTGDTITADRLNRMDRGWSIDSTQLFSETVTTKSGFDGASCVFEYSTPITADMIIVTFDGTAYTCNVAVDGSDRVYGDFDFVTAPFAISSNAQEGNFLYTPETGTYTVEISTLSIEVSSQFVGAVNSAIPELIPPFRLVEGETAISEFKEARGNGRLCYMWDGLTQYTVIGTYLPSSGKTPLVVSPTPSHVSFAFDSDGILRSY